ncbi:N-acetyltransferase [Staphylococcus arlettae]|jgi:RimJ/RimL family protein N-acetyltransferase|uniref:GNAT family N-acetyltransferase n=1 Tax=Staphylococcus TaxID=1279 RepID=UPI000D1A69BA|nr:MULTISPECIES: GNAT family N-acetyltransferase [Staphylococcus]MCD8834302.1 GNAT family N-acetyltransferase [Staphylococcus arlettae]MCD9054797.1 GNAT family N-acetyltransferase [Staphylococcus arlettae]MCP8714129.1 GNAT family N-acetyltransferase [Staphylococcus arlettae]MDN0187466.1 GNAT family N-acetyltransferase [Staphylococcus arlettae]MEB5899751.1 GNAT family N-acetyltransferase [Staphylococcus arlettae]
MDTIKLSNITQIQSFINSADRHMASYLYKLPQQEDALLSLIEQSIEAPGVYARVNDNNQVQMLLLAVAYGENKFKMIGPFIAHGLTDVINEFNTLFTAMYQAYPATANFNFTFEETEQDFTEAMKTINAYYNFTDYHLEATSDVGELTHEQNITEYHPAYYRSFGKLHEHTFYHDAMTTDEIINSLKQTNHLFTFMSEGVLKGYVYLQVFENAQTAEIKYFTSHSDYRFMGIAFDLLKYTLHYAFAHYNLSKISFKIRSKNATLVERFDELGFHINNEFKKFKFVLANV